ncbi:MAG: glycosyltransferase family protein [Egibacteraceae bacterium]
MYSRSRGTLNDHWTDMKEFGFVNNRILDALACGLPVISDWHQELESIFPDQVLFYRDKDGFTDCLEALLLDYPRVQERVQAAGQAIRKEFSFKQRAQQLAELATTTRVRSTDRKGS